MPRGSRDLDGDRQAAERRLPIGGPRDHAEMRGFARADRSRGRRTGTPKAVAPTRRFRRRRCRTARNSSDRPFEPNGMKDRSRPVCATTSCGVFSRRSSSGDGLGSRARPLASVVAASTGRPLLPGISTRAPSTGKPVRIDCTNTSRLPSFACLTMKPRSVTRISRGPRCPRRTQLARPRHRPSSGPFARMQQEQAAAGLRFVVEILPDIDAVVSRFAGSAGRCSRAVVVNRSTSRSSR